MWFKTRVGFVSVREPSEILVAKHTKEGIWSVFASLKAGPEMTLKNFLGVRSTISNPSVFLAVFSDSPIVSEAIADCMARIEISIRTKAELCDLSQVGDSKAWAKNWQQIQWPKGNPNT